MTHRMFDFTTLDPRSCYKLLIGAVVPRPIAWVTTRSLEGVVNAAPYSFFNCVSSDPPILCLGIENKGSTSFKDTGWNIRTTEEFTVNIVDDHNIDAMNVTATSFPPDVDELAMAGLTAVPGLDGRLPAHRGGAGVVRVPPAHHARRWQVAGDRARAGGRSPHPRGHRRS